MNNKLSPHQIELLKKASLTPQQILSNLDALNEEIVETYDQTEALNLAAKDKSLPEDIKNTITNSGKTTAIPIEENTMNDDLDMDDDLLEKEAEQAQQLLEQMKQQLADEQKEEESPEEELSPEEKQRKMILDLLHSVKNAPTEQQIEALKAKYGKNGVHVLALGEDDIYIFTYLRRGQWQKIQQVVQAAVSADVNANPEELLKEKVIQYTVKWPKGIASPEFLYNSRAGVVDTLYQTILLHSYFLSPQQAMMLTTQL